jgi:hypothetical protein
VRERGFLVCSPLSLGTRLEIRTLKRYVRQNLILSNIGKIAMAKASASKSPTRRGKRAAGTAKSSLRQTKTVHREPTTGRFVVSKARFEAVMRAAEQSGLLNEKGGRIGGRVSPALVRQAKRQTGIETDTDLIEFALATVALEDNFADVFKESRGKVDPKLKLGF